jgi:16S rRNA (cytosine1402-N4)-methyltransferase
MLSIGRATGETSYVYHTPVLLAETLQFLSPHPTGIYVDATVGSGGHAEAILNQLSDGGKLIGLDADSDAIEFAANRLKQFGARVTLVQGNFRTMKSILRELEVDSIDGLLFDLGVSSHQLDEVGRGFSFRGDERLDMRMDKRQKLDAWTVINHYPEESLAEIFWKYGEERLSRRIAARITRYRAKRPIETTGALAEIVRSVVGMKFVTKSLARVFQAIRIEVNQELQNLEAGLHEGIDLLRAGGRLVVLSYHSLEDRIVKTILKEEASGFSGPRDSLLPQAVKAARLKILTKKPLVPSREETLANPRARSARLRAAEKIT